MVVRNEDLFYCYSKKLSSFIYEESGIVPLTIAKNMKSGKDGNVFSLYAKSPELQRVLDKYREQNS